MRSSHWQIQENIRCSSGASVFSVLSQEIKTSTFPKHLIAFTKQNLSLKTSQKIFHLP